MKRLRFGRLAKVLTVFALLMTLPLSASFADPVTLTLADGSGNGDDDSYKMEGVSIYYDGVYYNDVYISTNNVLSFGAATTDYADDDEFPTVPSVNLNHDDWTFDYEDGLQNDEYFTVSRSGNTITIEYAAVPYNTNNEVPTVTVWTIILDSLGNATYSYTVDGVAGSLAVSNVGPLVGGVLSDGLTLVPITVVNTMRRTLSSALSVNAAPTITESAGKLTCSSGNFDYLNGGSTKQAASLSSAAYTLVVDGVEVSRVIAGNRSLPAHMLSTLTNQYAASATLESATFDLAGKSNYKASCKVQVTQGSTVLDTASATIKDSGMLAMEKQAADAETAANLAAFVEKYSKENRELRKRKSGR